MREKISHQARDGLVRVVGPVPECLRRALEPLAGIRALSFHLGSRTLTVDAEPPVVQAAAYVGPVGLTLVTTLLAALPLVLRLPGAVAAAGLKADGEGRLWVAGARTGSMRTAMLHP